VTPIYPPKLRFGGIKTEIVCYKIHTWHKACLSNWGKKSIWKIRSMFA